MSVDLTKKEVLLPIARLEDMYKRGLTYSKKNPNEKDFKVFVIYSTKKEYVMWSKVKQLKSELATRIKKYKDENKGVAPTSVWIVEPKKTATVKKDPAWKTNKYILAVMSVIGKFDDYKTFVEAIRAFAKKKKGLYRYYLNSRLLGTQKEIDGLTNGLLGNCVDWSQFAYAILTIMGYKVRYAQWQCKDVTHLTIEILISNTWTVIDLAAIVDADSPRYEIGQHWCNNPPIRVAINPGFMFEKGAVV